MLLLHQTGSVKIGEVVRYTVTYTPAYDRILPSPQYLYLKVKNTSAIALRAAFVHGPYTLYVSSSPSNFEPNEKSEDPRRDGVPEFEPNLKAGGTWFSELHVPDDVRDSAGSAQAYEQDYAILETRPKSVSWIIEVTSQVIFSNSATVHYEILLGRDEKSLSLGFSGLTGTSASAGLPGQVSDHQQSQGAKDGHHTAQQKGVFSRAIFLHVDDTANLWNKPKLPQWDEDGEEKGNLKHEAGPVEVVTNKQEKIVDQFKDRKQKKIHLVVLTHGLHSNLGADMLYLKESIDAASRKAKDDAKERRAKMREEKERLSSVSGPKVEGYQGPRKHMNGVTKPPAEQGRDDTDEEEDDEDVIVRGFSGNAVRTEKGIKYLGKRLAKYVLSMTYPDQPYLPLSRHTSHNSLSGTKTDSSNPPVHSHSTIHREPYTEKTLAYKVTSISFIAHSLGGLIQTYAVAYIQKHSPHFFDTIQPINFIALATPFLGLSNENPLYVKFALDFGLVGRTGQDLGLTWRAPTIARSGWGAIVSGIGEKAHKGEEDPGSKPLLRILPTGPAHVALKKFRNRTVYSNVVNDGIVPLRTSCLLFLDWQGLDRVEKARRENGLVGTMAGWGWAELTGANSSTSPRRQWMDGQDSDSEAKVPAKEGIRDEVPQPPVDATDEDDTRSLKAINDRRDSNASIGDEDAVISPISPTVGSTSSGGALDSILGLFRSNPAPNPHKHIPKHAKIYKRSQTRNFEDSNASDSDQRSKATSGEPSDDSNNLSAPPKTSFFEAAGDLLNPPLPPVSFLVDPSSRPRTIFHDRVYHPDDIPPPPLKRRSTSLLSRRMSSSGNMPSPAANDASLEKGPSRKNSLEVVDGSAMKVEEKIARAYHRDLSWRKVLVRLEPDAHNNMIVRRQFANAYGWPVVKHLVDTHFSDQAVATMRDEDEGSQERAKSSGERPSASGDEIKRSERAPTSGDKDDVEPRRFFQNHQQRTDSEVREATDHVPPLNSMQPGSLARALNSSTRPTLTSRDRQESVNWSDGDFADSDGDSDVDSHAARQQKISAIGAWNWTEAIVGRGATSPKGTIRKELHPFPGRESRAGDVDRQQRPAEDSAAAKVPIGGTQAGYGPESLSISERYANMRLGVGQKDKGV